MNQVRKGAFADSVYGIIEATKIELAIHDKNYCGRYDKFNDAVRVSDFEGDYEVSYYNYGCINSS